MSMDMVVLSFSSTTIKKTAQKSNLQISGQFFIYYKQC